ncbi:MAG: hypothetical protein H7101_03780, partial [Deinococcales bacterium]|nr:hypothetical protein [Chitinophagaceae bacterium]
MQYGISIVKRIPVLRLLLPFIAGILLQFYYHVTLKTAFIFVGISFMLFCGYLLLSNANKFKHLWVNGFAISLLFVAIGSAVGFIKNSQHQPQHIGNYYASNNPVIVTLQEPLVTKPKSYKALATIDAILV